MEAYWYKVCPRCDGQGRLVICKRSDNGALFFHCDECEAAWNTAAEIGDPDKVFMGVDIPATRAGMDDIARHGWTQYAKKPYHK
ncbi:hypothetical protein RBA41_20550 [Massilia sp. CCM 9210]|uniref:hypothetical protein n=1 Tax=Massilia scottii TaxID=3057166 RepID=UPI0027969DC3|nr:hypothetical protein [Massilia sp. CCM 9210]MDQ1815690.1 hypothetical protein [Massilia sp. CCM 9210]